MRKTSMKTPADGQKTGGYPAPLGHGGQLRLRQLDLLVDQLLKLRPEGVDDLLDAPVGGLGTFP